MAFLVKILSINSFKKRSYWSKNIKNYMPIYDMQYIYFGSGCQKLGSIYQLDGVCAHFVRRVGEYTFCIIYICIG